jgi:hypothetical protein
VLQRYTGLTGRMPLPPRWALGYHQSRWGYTEAQLRTVAAELRRRAIPADGLFLDEGMRKAAPQRRPFVLSRAGYAGLQRHAAHWTGDAPSTWDTLRQTLPMLLGLGLSGLPFVGSDVGGYSGGASAALYARWVALGSISPFFRGHTTRGVNNQEPWEFGPQVEEISRDLIQQRYQLLPYLYSLFHQAAETGAPVLRPLIYEFQDDPAVRNLGSQAMLGPWLLCAPVTQPDAEVQPIYLPAGRWFELRSGALRSGPATVDEGVGPASFPGARCPSRAWLALPDGSRINVTADGHNGWPYQNIGRLVLRDGRIPKDQVTPPGRGRAQHFLLTHPEELRRYWAKNPHFVYFRETPLRGVGKFGELCPGRSAAVDPAIVPMGAALFLRGAQGGAGQGRAGQARAGRGPPARGPGAGRRRRDPRPRAGGPLLRQRGRGRAGGGAALAAG